MWINICRNEKKLTKIQNKVHNLLDVDKSASKLLTKDLDIDNAIQTLRKKIRTNNYFTSEKNNFTSLSGFPLDQSLLKFTEISTHKRIYHIRQYHLGEKLDPPPNITSPVYVTEEERKKYESIENQTIDHIVREIQKMIDDIEDPDVALLMQQRLHQTKKKKKEIILALHGDVSQFLSSVKADQDPDVSYLEEVL